MELYIKVK